MKTSPSMTSQTTEWNKTEKGGVMPSKEVRGFGPYALFVAIREKARLSGLVEFHLRGVHDQKSHGNRSGGGGSGCGPIGCGHLDLSSKELAKLRDQRRNRIEGQNKGVKFLATTPLTGPVRLDDRASWGSTLSEQDIMEAERRYKGSVVVGPKGVLKPSGRDTSHVAYQMAQAGLDSVVTPGFVEHLLLETEPVTVEEWPSPKAGYRNDPLRVYAVPGTSEFLLGIAVRADGGVATMYPVFPDGRGVLDRGASRPMVERLAKKQGVEVLTETIKTKEYRKRR